MSRVGETLIIAIDGPAASGKGSLGRKLALALDLVYLDTGKLYRAVGYLMMARDINIEDLEHHDSKATLRAVEVAKNLSMSDIENENLMNEGVGAAASIVSSIPEVRKALLRFQQNVAYNPKGAVLDGRDIGSVVCPDADFKFYITADIETRAERRFKELQKKDSDVIYAGVLGDLERRDTRDSLRKIAPLKVSEDAMVIDTTSMSMEKVLEKVLTTIRSEAS